MPAENQAGKWWGRVHLFVLGLIVLAVIIAGVFNASPVAPDPGPTDATGAAFSTFDLRVGECFDLETTDGGETITDVFRRACDREHQTSSS